jgi:S-formylglutathione hydrolase FrmB
MHRRSGLLALLAVAAAIAALAACAWAAPSAQPGVRVATLSVDSAAVGRRLPVKVVLPEGGPAGRPLLVFLHGRGQSERSFLGPVLDGLAALGPDAPIVALPYGGDHSYWHDRADGAWGRYVMREVIPLVADRFGADRRRVAIGGISMGGFGAYDLARLHPRRFCAAGGHSPALWRGAGETAPGAFDDAADFARHDLIGAARKHPGRFRHTRLWLDAGDADPFDPGDRAFASALHAGGARVTVRRWPGGHDGAYWDAHWRDYLRFYARVLKRC